MSCGDGDVAVRTNLCSEFRTALRTEIVLRACRHILLALEFYGAEGDVFSRRKEYAAVFAACRKDRARKVDVLSRADGKDALSATGGDPGGCIQDILMGELLCRAFRRDIVLCLKENFFVTDDRTLYVYVMIGFQSDVFRTDQSRIFDISRLCEDILAVDCARILQCIFRLDDDVSCRDETAARGESQTVRVLGVENRIYGAFLFAVYIDIALFEPDHIRGEGCDLFFGEGNAGSDVHLFCIRNPRIHKCPECGFVVGIAFEVAFAYLF